MTYGLYLHNGEMFNFFADRLSCELVRWFAYVLEDVEPELSICVLIQAI